jgi:methylenetetrahydrofolate dehydrogenase (NAD+)
LSRCVPKLTDQNFDADVKDKASIYVPAIGKVTIVILLRNLLRIVQNRPSENGSRTPKANASQSGP